MRKLSRTEAVEKIMDGAMFKYLDDRTIEAMINIYYQPEKIKIVDK